MSTRRSLGQPPQIVFTSDFHQLVMGAPHVGACVLRYDPFRIIPVSEFDAELPIEFNVLLHPTAQHWQQRLSIPRGVLKPHAANPAGQGYMFEVSFDLPEGCDELECWFCYNDATRLGIRDDNRGANYWLRFPLGDLSSPQGAIVNSSDASVDLLQVEVTSVAEVEEISVGWRLTRPVTGRVSTPMVSSSSVSTGAGAGKSWKLPAEGVPVTFGATGVFDFVYTVGGRQFFDNNEGNWYLAAPAAVLANQQT